MQAELPVPPAAVPTAQSVHEVEPVPPVKLPAAQGVQLLEPVVPVNRPMGHARQVVVGKFQPGR